MDNRIKVFIADDSLLFRTAMIQALAGDPLLAVVGATGSSSEGKSKLSALSPDVLVVGAGSVSFDGADFLKSAQLAHRQLAAVAVGTDLRQGVSMTRAGATDFLKKPVEWDSLSMQKFKADLVLRIKAAASGRLSRARQEAELRAPMPQGPYAFDGVVALGASTGGTQSTARILRMLPSDFPGVVIVQHMPPNFTRMYAENLNKECALTIREAQDGDAVMPGHVLIAPGDAHMRLVKRMNGFAVSCTPGPKIGGHCPSVNELFLSVARLAGRQAVGVILTGMGADGAVGLTEMRARGAYTIGQDESTCVVYGMPREAYEMGGVVRQAPLDQIPSLLMRYMKDMR